MPPNKALGFCNMPSKEEKKRRRQIVKDLQAKKWAEAEASMPISKTVLKKLLDHFGNTLFKKLPDGTIWCYCDHTLNKSRAFLLKLQTPEDKIEIICEWFGEYGGFCDCEVYSNVGNGWYDRL